MVYSIYSLYIQYIHIYINEVVYIIGLYIIGYPSKEQLAFILSISQSLLKAVLKLVFQKDSVMIHIKRDGNNNNLIEFHFSFNS